MVKDTYFLACLLAYNAKQIFGKGGLKSLYFTFVHSYLKYGNIALGTASKTKLKNWELNKNKVQQVSWQIRLWIQMIKWKAWNWKAWKWKGYSKRLRTKYLPNAHIMFDSGQGTIPSVNLKELLVHVLCGFIRAAIMSFQFRREVHGSRTKY